LYAQEIRPQRLTLTKVGLHHAVLSLFDTTMHTGFRLNYHIESEFFEKLIAGELVLAVGAVKLSSTFTYASERLYFAAVYLGKHHVIGGYADDMDEELFESLFLRLRDAFRNSDLGTITSEIYTAFGEKRFSMDDVFADEREQLIARLLENDIHQAEDAYRAVYERTYTLVNMLRQQKKQIPELLLDNTEVVINADLRRWFKEGNTDVFALDQLTEAALKWKIVLDKERIGLAAATRLQEMVKLLSVTPYDFTQLDLISRVLIRLNDIDIKFRLWKIQNRFFRIGKDHINNKAFMRNLGDEEYKKWLVRFKAVGEQLKIRF
jgi:hypothetical protein